MVAPRQLDLLTDWTPPEAVERFDPALVRAATLTGRIAKTVSAALKGKNRDDIAKRMSDWIGSEVSRHMLDAYASEAREDHVISLPRALALLHATRDRRLLQALIEDLGWAIVEARHVPLIDLAEIEEERTRLGKLADAKRREARR